MIIYDLICSAGHRFEGWFKSVEDYQGQLAGGMLNCPVCNCAEVVKLPTASHLSTPSNHNKESEQPLEKVQEYMRYSQEVLGKLRDYVDKHFENVGERFPEEARRIHYGETRERSIRGVATPREVKDLTEEGIELVALPASALRKDKLN